MMVSGTSLSIEMQQPCAPAPPVALALERHSVRQQHVAKKERRRRWSCHARARWRAAAARVASMPGHGGRGERGIAQG